MGIHSGSWRLAALVVLTFAALPAPLLAQNPAGSQDSSPPVPGTGFIVGQVVDASSNKPIGGVTVALGGGTSATVLTSSSGAPRQVLTDSNGNFVFHSLNKGRYTIRASAPQYVPGGPGQHRPNGPTQPLELVADDSKVGGVVVRLWRFASITGTVVDEAGELVVGLNVNVFRRTTVNGQPRLTQSAGATTDDRSIYRLATLIPGDYIVAVISSGTTIPVSTAEAYMQAMTMPSGMANSEVYRSLTSSGAPMMPTSGQPVGDLLFQAGSFGRMGALTTPAPGEDSRPHVYPTTAYVAAASLSQGTVITLASGENRTGVDLQLKLVPTVRVSGTVIGPEGPMRNTAVKLVPPGTDAFVPFAPAVETTTVTDAAGAFTFLGVTPGTYTLKVARVPRPAPNTMGPSSGMTTIEVSGPGGMNFMGMSSGALGALPPLPPPIPQEPTLWAAMPIQVDDTDVGGVTVALRTGVRVSGRVQFEGTTSPPTPDQLQRINISIASPEARMPNQPITQVRVEADGRVNSGGFVPGRYQIGGNVPSFDQRFPGQGLQPGWMFKSATLNGRNLADEPLELDAEDITGVVITFTDRPSQLSGTVSDKSAEVVVFPADSETWRTGLTNARRIRSTRVSQAGTYEFPALPAGDYFVIALDADSSGDPQDPRFLDRLIALAARVTIGDGEKKTQDLVAKAVR